ncbi:GRP family sugar transporter [Lapidilactobacillus bayanensis]|uniref:GRP family sugar transporter n=1 Tax=Lapidilactobacillus bayanensis TaxID=2485998 RepID=UPI000F7B1E3E|nr:GRP family sugar transporter [Lapidilactobacillus bayanensis]
MTIVWLFVPALAWGILPLAIAYIGGNAKNQIFGTAIGTLITSFFVLAFNGFNISAHNFILAMLAGAFWIGGQIGQYTAYQNIGVSKTMPVSTGLQLIGTSLIGVLIFGEWSTIAARILGFIGIALLVAGVFLTAYTENKNNANQKNSRQTYLVLISTTIGYLIYNTLPKAMSASGLAIFFPESIGMVLAVLSYLLSTKSLRIVTEKKSWLNVISGLIFSIAAITYIFSVRDNGVNTAFVVGQLSVVLSTIGSMILLKEHKTKRELSATILGLIVIVTGAIITTIG